MCYIRPYFFLLGVAAVLVRSDLEIPTQIAKFLSLYLLFDIGLKGGAELSHSGFSPVVGKVMLTCLLFSFITPFIVYQVLRKKLPNHDAAAIAGTYGSVSAVTFATGISYLQQQGIHFGGYMVAGMALMESPAIISGLILYNINKAKASLKQSSSGNPEAPETVLPARRSRKQILHEACFNGSVFLLIGSLIIGFLSGKGGLAIRC